jgi:hypothetical protein
MGDMQRDAIALSPRGEVMALTRSPFAALRRYGRRLLRFARFAVLSLLGLVPPLRPDPAPPSPTRRDDGPAPRAAGGGDRFHDADHPVLQALRDKAIEDLFLWMGLDGVPPQMWDIARVEPDPAAAVAAFVRAVGCDPDAVRRRERAALSRLEAAVDALFAWSRAMRPTSDAERRRIQAMLFWADADEIALFQANAEAIAEILGAYDALPGTGRLARHEALVAALRRIQSDPLALDRRGREAALRQSAELVEATRRYAAVAARFDALVEELAPLTASLPEDDDRAALLRAAVVQRGDAEADLFGTGESEPRRLLDLLDGIVSLLDELAEAFAAASSRARDRGAAPGGTASAVDEALRFFGFPPGRPPDRAAVYAAYKRAMKDCHPDLHPGDAKASRLARETNGHWAVLEEWYRRTA